MAKFKFNSKGKERMGSITPLPAGKYKAVVEKSEIKKTKDKSGKYIKLTFNVQVDKKKRRKIFNNYNIVNNSVEAVEIAEKEISSLCDAVGIKKFSDTAQLHDKPLVIQLGIKNDEEYGPQNVIKGYFDILQLKGSTTGKKKKKKKKNRPF